MTLPFSWGLTFTGAWGILGWDSAEKGSVSHSHENALTDISYLRTMHISKQSIIGNATFVEKRHLSKKNFSPGPRFLHLLDRTFLTSLPASGSSRSSISRDSSSATGRPCQGPGGSHLRCITQKQSQHAPPAQYSPALKALPKLERTFWATFWAARQMGWKRVCIAHSARPALGGSSTGASGSGSSGTGSWSSGTGSAEMECISDNRFLGNDCVRSKMYKSNTRNDV